MIYIEHPDMAIVGRIVALSKQAERIADGIRGWLKMSDGVILTITSPLPYGRDRIGDAIHAQWKTVQRNPRLDALTRAGHRIGVPDGIPAPLGESQFWLPI